MHFCAGFTQIVRHPRRGEFPLPTPNTTGSGGCQPASHLWQPRQEAGNDAAQIPLGGVSCKWGAAQGRIINGLTRGLRSYRRSQAGKVD